ncbi:hypothetical protein AHAS_Ahas20G0338100 [Arachis hypogaea]
MLRRRKRKRKKCSRCRCSLDHSVPTYQARAAPLAFPFPIRNFSKARTLTPPNQICHPVSMAISMVTPLFHPHHHPLDPSRVPLTSPTNTGSRWRWCPPPCFSTVSSKIPSLPRPHSSPPLDPPSALHSSAPTSPSSSTSGAPLTPASSLLGTLPSPSLSAPLLHFRPYLHLVHYHWATI